MKTKYPDTVVTEQADGIGFLLWQVTTQWQRGVRKELDKIGITYSQFLLLAGLMSLSKQQDSIMQIHLSEHSNIDPMTTSAIIKVLQRKKLVEREEHHADSRAKKLSVTAEGIKTVKQATKMIEKFDNRFFKSLDKKEKGFREKLILLLPAEKKEK